MVEEIVTDIVERLRSMVERVGARELRHVMTDAAHEIELLRSELKLTRVPAIPIEAMQKIEQLSKENEALRADVEYYKLIWNQSEKANAQLCTTLAQIMSGT